jgi:hypothetical protein
MPVDAGAMVRATSKLEPSLPIADGMASGWLLAFSIVIGRAPVSEIDQCNHQDRESDTSFS